MNFRIIRKQVTSLSIAGASRKFRSFGFGTAICALIGTTVFAQTTNDFMDPLNDERVRIEQRKAAPTSSPAAREKPARPTNATTPERRSESLLARARDNTTSGAAAAQDRATGFWAKMRNALSDVSASLGLPPLGLLGILGFLLAGLAALVGWTLFRGKGRSKISRKESDIYASTGQSTQRRQLGDAIPFAASTDVKPKFEETMPEDFDTIFEEERSAAPTPQKSTDSSAWRKPNLDRLRASIKADWKADKVRSSAESKEPARAMTSTSTTDTDQSVSHFNDEQDGWEKWDEQVKPDDDPWGETLTTGDDTASQQDDAAIQRIRALRESLRAS